MAIVETTRRSILGALGAAAGFATTASATNVPHELVIERVCPGTGIYNVCASGDMEKADAHPEHAAVTHGYTCAEGTLADHHDRTRDVFHFSGNITHVSIEGPLRVNAAGEVVHEPDCAADGAGNQDNNEGQDHFCPLDNTLNIWTTKRVKFEVEVAGQLELPSGRRVKKRTGVVEPDDGVPRAGLTLPYSGEITHLQLRGDGKVTFEQPAPCD